MVVTAWYTSKGSSKALEVDRRALEAVQRISKTAIKASEAGGSTSEAAGGRFGDWHEDKMGKLEAQMG